MSRLFGAYVLLSFSAAEGRKTGESSVWIGVMKRDVRFRLSYEAHNPATRSEAIKTVSALLADLHKRGDRVLLGVDFPLGFPRGTVARLGLSGTPWQALWTFLAKNVVDKPDNTNNRFAVAAKCNRLMTDDAFPFWGCPKSAAQKWLSSLKPETYGDFPEFRLTETRIKGVRKDQPKSVWQMHGAGVAGGQSMLGIVALKSLLAEFGDSARVWPFSTGFSPLDAASLEGVSTVVAEVYPALYEGAAEPGEVKDATANRLAATALAELDDKGDLAALFAPPAAFDDTDLAIASTEEGWILGS